ncbi:MAG TPA: sodium:proton antiporter, partial [Hyphomicrobiaceae bacterium]|nr:sodium:proton antiporter [Hyphomicrobiaceae bacterium]
METVTLVLLLLVALLTSSFLLRMSRLPLPLPLVQIAIGAIIASVADLRVVLEPEIFFLLFLPPLLFIDGWRIPKQGLFRDAGTILELALGLVVFTVVGMALFLHWLIPTMPLAVCFALAAVLSPTDPVAVSSIATRVQIPKRMMHILEGESLLNDASGLVCLRFAVAAAVTGSFSLPAAFLSFLQLAIGGIAIGVGITWGINTAKNWISRRYGEEPGVQILVSLLIPFAAYLAAERLHCSGILAAVAAGIT